MAAAATTSRKPRTKPERSFQLLEPATAATDGWAAVRITVGKETAVYLVRSIPADFGIGFEVEKLDDGWEVVETYHVNLMGRESSCTCPGHTYHGYCKHVDSLTAMANLGKLPRLCPQHVDEDQACHAVGDVF